MAVLRYPLGDKMRIQVKLALAVAVVLLPGHTWARQAGFCASRTPQALHSPQCKWAFIVHDPHRVDNVTIPHKPVYHTYSRWMLDDRTFVFAYRDIDQQPEDMAVDIYLAAGKRCKRVGTVRIPGLVTNVSTATLTGGPLPDVVFYLESGELDYLDVVRFSDGVARQVFWYGASHMEITANPKPVIVAKSRIANLVEQFAWDSRRNKFRKVAEHPWHSAPARTHR